MNLPKGTLPIGKALGQLNLSEHFSKSLKKRDIFSAFSYLQEYIDGVYGGDVILIAARKGVGKTSFATTLIHYAATQLGANCFIGFFDTDFIDYSQRLVTTEARIDINQLITENISREELYRAIKAGQDLVKSKITLYSDPKAELQKLCNEIFVWAAACDINEKVIFIDTIQFLSLTDPSYPSQEQVLRELKRLAESTGAIILVTTMVNADFTEAQTLELEHFEGGEEFTTHADIVLGLNTYSASSSVTVIKRRGDQSRMEFPVFFNESWQTWLPTNAN